MRIPLGHVGAIAAVSLTSCLAIPLPRTGPDPEHAVPVRIGDSESSVRAVYGVPNRLDSGRFLLYEWSTDRDLLVVPAVPTGVPVAAIVAGGHHRLLIELDEQRRVAMITCSHLTRRDGPPVSGCMDVTALRADIADPGWFDLAQLPQLAGARFRHAELSGSATAAVLSHDGSVLALSDTRNRTWLIDIDARRVIGSAAGTPPSFFSMRGVAEPRAAFSRDGRTVVVAQDRPPNVLQRDGDDFVERPAAWPMRIAAPQFTCCPETVTAVREGDVVQVDADGSVLEAAEAAGRLRFAASGALVEAVAGTSPMRGVRLASRALEPRPLAVFHAHPSRNAVLDTRNDFARERGAPGFALSDDGKRLARNTGSVLELWDSEELFEHVSRDDAAPVAPERVLLMPARDVESELAAHLPVAFDARGRLVAAGVADAVHVWSLEIPRRQHLLNVDAHRPRQFVIALAVDAAGRVTAVFTDMSGNVAVARWALPL